MNDLLCTCGIVALLVATGISVGATPPVDFDTEVMPILSHKGCNAAACHGGAKGRGGLKLSLFGGQPADDYHQIVWQFEGRRVNLVDPTASLIVAKPSLEVEHGGGERFSANSDEQRTLLQWIAQGAKRLQRRSLIDLRAIPNKVTLTRNETLPYSFSLRVEAHYDDGTVEQIAPLAIYSTTDRSMVTVSDCGHVDVLQSGRSAVLVRFLSQTVSVPVTVPFPAESTSRRNLPFSADASNGTELDVATRENWIDRQIDQSLREIGLRPGARAADAELLRRLHLDLVGRLPSSEQIDAYVNDRRPHPTKSHELIDALLASDEFTTYWTHVLEGWLGCHVPGDDTTAGEALHKWLRDQVAKESGWHAITRQLLLARGDSHRTGAATYHRLFPDAYVQAEQTAEVFMGVRLRCANCHNHPLDQWTQDDYHGLAQLFVRITRGRHVGTADFGEIIHPGTGNRAISKLPGDVPLPADREKGLAEFVNWLVDRDNPYFARAVVNRVWAHCFGRGLVDPPDDLRVTNPSSHPELEQRLIEFLRANQFRFRPLLRAICTSDLYQRTSTDDEVRLAVYGATRHVRPMPPLVLADAIADATGIDFAGEATGRRLASQYDAALAAEEMLGPLTICDGPFRCGRDTNEYGIATELLFLNGPLLNERIRHPAGRLAQLLANERSDSQIISTLYLATLSRRPSARDFAIWALHRRAAQTVGDDATSRIEFYEDMYWSLLRCREFTHY